MFFKYTYSQKYIFTFKVSTRLGVDKVKPKEWFKYSLYYRLTIWNSARLFHVPPCSFQHGRPAFGPSCTEFVYTECWHFDNDATSKIGIVLTEHGGLLHVLPLAVHLRFFLLDNSLSFFVRPLLHA